MSTTKTKTARSQQGGDRLSFELTRTQAEAVVDLLRGNLLSEIPVDVLKRNKRRSVNDVTGMYTTYVPEARIDCATLSAFIVLAGQFRNR